MVKRTLDLVLAVGLVLLLLPLLVVVGVAIAIECGENPIYLQSRVGLRGKRFLLCKFRTMTAREVEPEPSRRVTTLGRYFRRSRIDELPQLFNVIRGDMSLVGPRPFSPEVFKNQRRTWPEGAHWERVRHTVRPGMTGPWQLSSRATSTVEELFSEHGAAWRHKRDELVALDLGYVGNQGLSTDLGILARTVIAIAGGRNQGA